MPSKHDHFALDRSFTPEQMKALRKGNIPQEMEDKWFWYMEGDTLFAHRSWTGFCIYRIDCSPNNHHKVTVNRDPEQYECTNVDEDRDNLNKLLDWWTEAPYAHYGEWLTKTVDALKKGRYDQGQAEVRVGGLGTTPASGGQQEWRERRLALLSC